MALFFNDFSRVQFSNIVGTTLPRRQRLRFNGLTARDAGDEIILQTTSEYTTYTPEQYGAVGDGVTDDSAACQTALNAIRDAGGGRLLISGNYLVENLNVYSNTLIEGGGWHTGFTAKASYLYVLSTNFGNGGTADPADNIRNVRMKGFFVRGRVVEDGFWEHYHNIRLSATTDATLEELYIVAARGDGILVAAGTNLGFERHNVNIRIIRCLIDGVNKDNRNGISVIDCDGCLIEETTIKNHTRSNMPGAVDLEPDEVHNTLRNITVRRVVCRNIGGNVGAIGANLPDNDTMNVPIEGITIDEPDIQGCAHGLVLLGKQCDKPYKIRVYDPRIKDIQGNPLSIIGVKDAEVHGGLLSEAGGGMLIGYDDPVDPVLAETYRSKDIRVRGLRVHRCGKGGEVGIGLARFNNVEFSDLIVDDCGLESGAAGTGISLISTGAVFSTSGLTLNKVEIAGTRTTAATSMNANHVMDPMKASSRLGKWAGLSFGIPVARSDDEVKVGSFTTATLPDSFETGWSMAVENNAVVVDAGLPDLAKFGLYLNYKPSMNSGYRRSAFQMYWPGGDTFGARSGFYIRRPKLATNEWHPFSLFSNLADAVAVRDVPSIADGDSYMSADITCPGAEAGDICKVSCSVTTQGMGLTAEAGADVVRFILVNNTGAAVDLGSATFRIRVEKGIV